MLEEGTEIGDYVIIEHLATGGCGSVYRAAHRVLGRPFAIKVLRSDLVSSREMRERLIREAQATARLRHPNLVEVYGYGELADGRPFFVMELLSGADLDDILSTRGRFSPADTLAILTPICTALQVAHDAGIIHRDLKASNVFMADTVGGTVVKLLDFSIAKLLESPPQASGLTSAQRMLGTPSAMAPEQIRGEPVDARTDIYALGVLAFQLLTGQLPYDADEPHEVEYLHLEGPIPHPSHLAPLSAAIDDVIRRALAKEATRRHATVRAFLSAFTRAVGRPHVLADRPGQDEAVLHPGTHVRDHVVDSLIAIGGFGNVYCARHALLGRRAALKVLHAELATNKTIVNRFIREARAVNLIRHPNVVDVYDVGTLGDGRPFLLMELLEGMPLDAYLERHKRLSPAETLALLEPVCNALAAAHEHGIIHRDVKASNIFLCGDQPPARVVLLDFGVAKLVHEPGLTPAGLRQPLGTPECAAPEQLLGQPIDARADVYALGTLAFQMLTGQLPFAAKSPAMRRALLLHAPRPLPSSVVAVSAEIDDVIVHAMNPRPENRFAGAREFLEALRGATMMKPRLLE